MKITILDAYAVNPGDLEWAALAQLGELTIYDRTSPGEVWERAKDSEIILTNKTILNAQIISKLPKLRYIGVLATGYNVVDIEAAKKAGIIVTNIPAYSTMSVAQKVFALLLAVTDRVEHYSFENKKGRWSKNADFCWWDTPLIELQGKTFGVYGLGNIGSAVAKIANSFGMRVLAVTSKPENQLPSDIYSKVSPEELFRSSDIISLHCPLTPSTKNIINKESISLMKEGVIIINTARGGLIDEEAVAQALRTGKIGAFCADVVSMEPPNEDNPVLTSPNTFITPHIAWATSEARARMIDIAVKNVNSFIEGKPVNVVS